METKATTPRRKTAKYYRDILCGGDLRLAVSLIPEIFRKYGFVGKWRTAVRFGSEYVNAHFNRNHAIEGLFLGCKDGKVYADVYWQGDSTDGNASVRAESLVRGDVTVPAEWDEVGGPWGRVCRHSPLVVTTGELRSVLKELAGHLTPEASRARKNAREREEYGADLHGKINRLVINPKFTSKYSSYFGMGGYRQDARRMEPYRNGEEAVREFVFGDPKRYALMPDEELRPIVVRVFERNEKPDADIPKDKAGKKVFDLSL